MPDITVKTVKGFDNQGEYAKRGSTITVDEFRAADLHANGLIEDYKMKKAEEPSNKKASDPTNKAAAKPKNKAE
jgi:predicted homoserine dehydrogenase-like protein